MNCSLYWESASSHARLADALARAGDLERARESALRALERNDGPDRIEELLELVERTTSPPAPTPAAGAVDVVSLEDELRATETAFAAAFAAGDMDAFADFVADETAISLQRPLLERIDAAAGQLGMSRSRLVSLATDEFVTRVEKRRHENRDLLAQINEAYADAPNPEEREVQERLRRLERRRGAAEW